MNKEDVSRRALIEAYKNGLIKGMALREGYNEWELEDRKYKGTPYEKWTSTDRWGGRKFYLLLIDNLDRLITLANNVKGSISPDGQRFDNHDIRTRFEKLNKQARSIGVLYENFLTKINL